MVADESVPPPQMSTPTVKSVHLPDLSTSPVLNGIVLSPASPMSAKRSPAARTDADLARLQKAIAPNFMFPARRPLSPSSDTLPPPLLSTPLNESQSKDPSSPKDSTDLLNQRSFVVEEEALTPLKDNEASSLSTLKTPRFPGAFGTPGPAFSPSVLGPMSQNDTLNVEDADATPKINPVDGLPPTHIQTSAHTFMPLTPAPPGAYWTTPTSAKRKGILKVRFDGDVQPPEDAVDDPFAGSGSTGSTANGSSSSSPSEGDVPPLSLSPSRRKGLRLVDEYGRARRFTEDGEEILLDTRRKTGNLAASLEMAVPDDTTTPRRRAKMRQVDALGNEVNDGMGWFKKDLDREVPESQRRTAVLSRLAKSLGELQDDLVEEENA